MKDAIILASVCMFPACEDKNADEQVEIIINTPKTTETQKEVLIFLNVLGVLPATLQKQVVEKDEIITAMSYYNTQHGATHNMTLNENMTDNGKVTYDVVRDTWTGIKSYQRETFEKTSEGLLKL